MKRLSVCEGQIIYALVDMFYLGGDVFSSLCYCLK